MLKLTEINQIKIPSLNKYHYGLHDYNCQKQLFDTPRSFPYIQRNSMPWDNRHKRVILCEKGLFVTKDS